MNKIISMSKVFVKNLRSDLKSVDGDDIFVISIVGDSSHVDDISVALHSRVSVSKVDKSVHANLYKEAMGILSLAINSYKDVSGVVIMLSNEYDTSVFRDNKVLRICNLDA